MWLILAGSLPEGARRWNVHMAHMDGTRSGAHVDVDGWQLGVDEHIGGRYETGGCDRIVLDGMASVDCQICNTPTVAATVAATVAVTVHGGNAQQNEEGDLRGGGKGLFRNYLRII